jgi:tetratricopeptide (TPR) repeat protein
MDVEKLYERASDALKRGNHDYAKELFLQVLTYNPDHAHARKGLLTAIMSKFQEKGAPSKVTTAILSTKTSGQISLNKNNPKKVMEIAQNHLLKDPENYKIRTSLASALLEMGYKDGAIAELESALEFRRDYVPAIKLLGGLYFEKRMLKEAEQILQIGRSCAPEDREIAKMLRDVAAASSMQAGFEEAKSYRDLIKDKERAEELERRTHLIKTKEEIQRELDRLKLEVEQNPSDVKNIKRLADFYFDRLKDYNSAKEWYKRASELNPVDSSYKNRYDDCIIRLYDAQIERLQKTGDPKLAEIKKNKLLFEINSFERRVTEMPTDMGLRFELGKRYYLAGKIDSAIAQFQQSVKDPKRKVDSCLYLGICFRHKTLYDLAIAQFEKALSSGILAGERPLLIRYNMARCYADAKDYSRAVAEGKKIMEVDINYKDISTLVEEWVKILNSQRGG